jgi:hypothetical protein
MKPRNEYREGPEVAEKFEEAMKIIFRTPKPDKKEPKVATSRKSKQSDKD